MIYIFSILLQYTNLINNLYFLKILDFLKKFRGFVHIFFICIFRIYFKYQYNINNKYKNDKLV